ncbi:MAG TPA: hypothetical protein GXX60_04940 [Anaerolineaceae bacterium]|nr:hypothetical protein [Anaerolineaceae bacterium]
MKTPKTRKIISLIIVLLVAITSLCGCGKPDSVKHKLVRDLRALAKIDNFDDLYVSIYWIESYVLNRYPWSKNDLLERADNVIILQGDEIKGKLEWFKDISEKDIELLEEDQKPDTRFYVLIESVEKGKLFELLMFGDSFSYFVNGYLIQWNDKIINALIPLLDEKAFSDLELYRYQYLYGSIY